MRPVIAASTGHSTGTRIANLRLAPHFTGDQKQSLVQHSTIRQVFNQRRETSVKLRQQVILETAKVISMSIPAATTGTLASFSSFFIAFPEDCNEGHARFDQAASQQQTCTVDAFAVPLAN